MSGRVSGAGLVLSEASPKPIQRLQVAFAKQLGRKLLGLDISVLSPPHREAAAGLRARFDRLAKQHRASALAIILRPQLHVHLHCALVAASTGDWDQARRHQEVLWPQLELELSLDEAADARDRLWPEVDRGTQVSPTHRHPAAQYAPISERIVLALVDTNPLSDLDAHPTNRATR